MLSFFCVEVGLKIFSEAFSDLRLPGSKTTGFRGSFDMQWTLVQNLGSKFHILTRYNKSFATWEFCLAMFVHQWIPQL